MSYKFLCGINIIAFVLCGTSSFYNYLFVGDNITAFWLGFLSIANLICLIINANQIDK